MNHALEKEMATHSTVLAWRIPGTEEPSGLLSMGLHRVKHLSKRKRRLDSLEAAQGAPRDPRRADRRVPAELGQESQASSCLRKGTPMASLGEILNCRARGQFYSISNLYSPDMLYTPRALPLNHSEQSR